MYLTHFSSCSRCSYCNSFIQTASREQHCYLFHNRTFSNSSGVWWVGGVWKGSSGKAKIVTVGWVTGRKRIKQQWLTYGHMWVGGWWGGGRLNIVIHCRSDGSQKIKIEMADLICVPFTVTLRCVSLSVCHIPQYGSYHHHHLLYISAHPSLSHFSLSWWWKEMSDTYSKPKYNQVVQIKLNCTCVHYIYLIELSKELSV